MQQLWYCFHCFCRFVVEMAVSAPWALCILLCILVWLFLYLSCHFEHMKHLCMYVCVTAATQSRSTNHNQQSGLVISSSTTRPLADRALLPLHQLSSPVLVTSTLSILCGKCLFQINCFLNIIRTKTKLIIQMVTADLFCKSTNAS